MKTMLSRTLAALLVAAAALPAVAVQAAKTLTVQTFNEKNATVEVVIPKDPKRVAVLDYAVLDTMDAWGLGNRVTALPKSTALPRLAKYKNDSKIVNTGTPKEVDFEALMASEPDVIFVSGRLVKKIPELRRIAPVIYQKTDRELGSLEQTKAKLVQLGGIFGKTAEAEAAGRAFDERAAAGRTAVVGMVTSSHFNMLGLRSKGSLIGNEFGFKNIAHGANTDHGSESSFELLVKLNPDFIFVCDRDSAISRPGARLAQDVMTNPLVERTDAAKNGRIVHLTSSAWYLAEGGLRATDICSRTSKRRSASPNNALSSANTSAVFSGIPSSLGSFSALLHGRAVFSTFFIGKPPDRVLAKKGDDIQPYRAITAGAIHQLLRARADESQVSSFTPHDLRRTFATRLLESGADINTVRQAMGHSSVVTTRRYDKRDEHLVEEATRKVAL